MRANLKLSIMAITVLLHMEGLFRPHAGPQHGYAALARPWAGVLHGLCACAGISLALPNFASQVAYGLLGKMPFGSVSMVRRHDEGQFQLCLRALRHAFTPSVLLCVCMMWVARTSASTPVPVRLQGVPTLVQPARRASAW